MAKSIKNEVKIGVACPSCKKSSDQSLARLEQQPNFTCPSCGHKFRVRFEGTAALKNLGEIDRILSTFGKRTK